MILSSVDRAMKVLELLSGSPKGLRLSELSELLQVNQSSMHHVLSTMMPYGYVQQDPETKKYSLGFRFLEVSRIIIDNLDLRTISHKHLEELRLHVEGATHLSILKDKKLVYVDKTEWPEGLSLATYIGYSTEAYAAAGGKVLLSHLKEQELDNMYAGVTFKAYTKNTLKDLDALKHELDQVRQQGYALDDEEYYEGVRCIAVPVYGREKVVAALSVTSSVFAYTKERLIHEVHDLALQTANNISKEMVWQ